MTKKIITPSDRDLFRQAVGNVQPVKKEKIELKPDTVPKPYPKPRPENLDDDMVDNPAFDIENVGHEESLRYAAPGIQNNVLAKLRKGVFGVQAELDLHGYTSEHAKVELLAFLSQSRTAGFRCVQIIHGKGYRASGNHPILKNHLNRWLRQHKDVQAFCSAPQRQGGTGAVYVLLKIAREF